MQWLSANFVKLGVAVLLIVGFVIRDDLFPGDHDAQIAEAEVASQSSDHASEPSVSSEHPPASTTTASTALVDVKQETKAESEESAGVTTQSADSTEMDKVAGPSADLRADPRAGLTVKPTSESALATESTNKVTTAEVIGEPIKPVQAEAAASTSAPSTTIEQDAQAMTGAKAGTQAGTLAGAESGMGSGFGSSFGSGFGASSNSQSAMDSGARAGTQMMGAENSRKAYSGDENGLKPHVNPVEVLSGARQAFWENRFADSAESYRVLLDIQPANWMAWGELGNVYYRKGEMDASGEAYYRSAVLMWHAHRYDEAWRLARIIGNLSPKRALDLAEVFYGDKAAGRSASPAPVPALGASAITEPTPSSPVVEGASPAVDKPSTPANDL